MAFSLGGWGLRRVGLRGRGVGAAGEGRWQLWCVGRRGRGVGASGHGWLLRQPGPECAEAAPPLTEAPQPAPNGARLARSLAPADRSASAPTR